MGAIKCLSFSGVLESSSFKFMQSFMSSSSSLTCLQEESRTMITYYVFMLK